MLHTNNTLEWLSDYVVWKPKVALVADFLWTFYQMTTCVTHITEHYTLKIKTPEIVVMRLD